MKKTLILVFVLLAAGMALGATPARAEGVLPDDGTTVWNEDFTLAAGDRLDSDLVVFNGDATLEVGSQVDGSVVVWNGDVEVAGTIDRDLVVAQGEVHLSSSALVRGSVVCSWQCSLERDEGARVDGNIVEGMPVPLPQRIAPESLDRLPVRVVPWSSWDNWASSWTGWVFSAFRSLAAVLLLAVVGGLVAVVWPRQVGEVGSAVLHAPGATFGMGLLSGVIAVAGIVALVFTICLALFGAVGALAVGVAWVFGWIGIGTLVGDKLLRAARVREVSTLWAAALGTFLVSLVSVGVGAVPCLNVIGGLITFVLGCMGLGAVVLTRFGRQPHLPRRATPPEPADQDSPAGEPEPDAALADAAEPGSEA